MWRRSALKRLHQGGGVFRCFEQRFDVLPGAAQRLARGDALERLLPVSKMIESHDAAAIWPG